MAGIKGNLNFENTDKVEFLLSTEGDVDSQRFIDISKNRFPITTNGNTKITDVDVNYGYSVYFDGTGDYLTLGSSASFAFGTGDFTIEAWIYTTANSVQGIISNGSGSVANPYLYLNGLTPTLFLNNTIIASGPAITLNTWHHIAVIRTGSIFQVYTNGVSGTPVSYSVTLLNSGLWIGAYSIQTQYFNGYISNLRIVKGTALYTGNFTPPTRPLSAISGTSLLTCQDNIVKDRSVNNFTITKNGNARESLFGPQTVKKSVAYFDGSGDSLEAPDNTAFDLAAGSWTIETFVYLSALPASNARYSICGQWGPVTSANNLGYLFQIFNDAGTMKLSLDWSTTGTNSFNSTATASGIIANVWLHIACVRSGNDLKMFVNGTEVTSGATISVTIFNSSRPLVIGRNEASNGNFINGYMASLRLVKGTAVYTTNFTPPSIHSKPINYITYKKDKNLSSVEFLIKASSAPTNTSFVESSYNNLTVTNNSSVTVSSTQSKFNSKSINFSGSNYLSIAANSRFLLGTNNFTIECWFYVTTLATAQSLITSHQIGGMFNIGINTSGRPYAGVNVSGGSSTAYANLTCTSSQVVINTWYHLAVIRKTTSLDIFLNGIKDQTSYNIGTSVVGSYGGNKPIYIGAGADTTAKMTGYIDNIRYTVGVARYSENFLVPTEDFTGVR